MSDLLQHATTPSVTRKLLHLCGSELVPYDLPTTTSSSQPARSRSKSYTSGSGNGSHSSHQKSQVLTTEARSRTKTTTTNATNATTQVIPTATWNILLLAARAGHAALPSPVQNKREFWFQAAETGRITRSDLPKSFRHQDARLAMECLYQTARQLHRFEPSAVRHVLGQHPHLLQQDAARALLPLLLYYKVVGYTDDFLSEHLPLLPSRIFENKALMLQAIRVHARSALQWMATELWDDAEIVQAAVRAMGAAALEFLPDPVQLNHPEWVAQAIQCHDQDDYSHVVLLVTESNHDRSESDSDDDSHDNDETDSQSGDHHSDDDDESEDQEYINLVADDFPIDQQQHYPTNIWTIYNWIHEDLFLNRQVALAWVSRGGEYLHDEFDEDLESDAELFLLIAEHNWCDFMFADEDALLSNKTFMARAVAKNGLVFREGRNGLATDYDLALIAFANAPDLLDHYEWSCITSPDFTFLTQFAKHVRDQIAQHEAHVHFVLGILEHEESNASNNGKVDSSIVNGERDIPPSINGKECTNTGHLDMLRVGQETTFAFSRKIAGYAGVPKSHELKLLRQASVNLAAFGL